MEVVSGAGENAVVRTTVESTTEYDVRRKIRAIQDHRNNIDSVVADYNGRIDALQEIVDGVSLEDVRIPVKLEVKESKEA